MSSDWEKVCHANRLLLFPFLAMSNGFKNSTLSINLKWYHKPILSSAFCLIVDTVKTVSFPFSVLYNSNDICIVISIDPKYVQ